MAINFPSNPSNGQVVSYAGVTYRFNSIRQSWDADRQSDPQDIPRTELESFINERLTDNAAYRAIYLPSIVTLTVDPNAPNNEPADPLTGSFQTIAGALTWLSNQRYRAGIKVQITLTAGTHTVNSVLRVNTVGISDFSLIGQSADMDIGAAAELAAGANAPAITTALRGLMGDETIINFASTGQLKFEGDKQTVSNILFTRDGTSVPAGSFISVDQADDFTIKQCSLYSLKVTGFVRTALEITKGVIKANILSCILADLSRAVQLVSCDAYVQDSVIYNCSEIAVFGVLAKIEALQLYMGIMADGIRLVSSSLRLNNSEIYRSQNVANIHLQACSAVIGTSKINSGRTGIYAITSTVLLSSCEVTANIRKGFNLFGSQVYMTAGSLTSNTDTSGSGGGRASNSSVTMSGVNIASNSSPAWEVAAGASLCLGNTTGAQANSANVAVDSFNAALGWVTNSI